MSEYEPGTVAVATVRGVKGVRVLRVEWVHGEPGWCHVATEQGGAVLSYEPDVTDVRPLVVLDAPQDDLLTAANHLRSDGWGSLADQIEAQTKPPRIPEPESTGSIVKDSDRLWVKAGDGLWICLSDGQSGNRTSWPFLENPTLIREGVSE